MASAFDKCIKTVSDVVTNAIDYHTAEGIVRAVHSIHEANLTNAADKAVARQLTMQQVAGLVDRESLALAQAKRQSSFQRLRFAQGRAKALGYDNLRDGWRSIYVGQERANGGARDSADSRMIGYYADHMSFLDTRLKEEGITNEFTSNTQDQYAIADMIQALGKEGSEPSTQADPTVVKTAKVIRETYARLREEMRRQGATIGEIQDYMGKQLHDADKMASNEKKLSWLWSMRERLNFDATLHPEADPNRPEVTTEKEKEDFLNSAYEAIITGVRYDSPDKAVPFIQGRGGNIANRMGAERTFVFKTPRDFVDHNTEWGRGSIKSLLLEAISTGSRQLGLLATTGPKPEQFHEDMHRALKEEARRRFEGEPEKQRKAEAELDAFHSNTGMNQLRELTAYTRGVDSKLMAYLGGEARALTGAAMLGFALPSSLNDLVWIGFDNKYMGDSPFKAFVSPFTDFLKFSGKAVLRNNVELDHVASETGAIAHITNEYMSARVGGNTNNSKGFCGKLAHTLHKISGLTFFDKANRVAMASQLMARLGNFSGMDHAELRKANPEFARTLGLYGIHENEWNVIRKMVEKSPVGYKYISGRSLDNLTDDQIKGLMTANGVNSKNASALTVGRYKSELRLKLFQMIIDRGDHGQFQQRTTEAAIFNRGSRRGNFWGETNRALGVFKSFPVAAYQRGMKRELTGRDVSTTRAVLGMGAMVLTMSAFGVAQSQLKRYLHGEELQPMGPHMLLDGAAEGGGLGIWTDFLTKEYSDSYGKKSFLDTILGPEIGSIGKAIDTLSEIKSSTYDPTMRGQAAADGLKLIKSFIPFQNLWYTNQAFNYYLWYQLEEYLHPGVLERQEAAKRRAGQGMPFMPPSAVANPPTLNPATITKRIVDYRNTRK